MAGNWATILINNNNFNNIVITITGNFNNSTFIDENNNKFTVISCPREYSPQCLIFSTRSQIPFSFYCLPVIIIKLNYGKFTVLLNNNNK